ncbi:DUF3800 domain-containing protein [Hyphomicrobium sulfonivorans]|uniref:DUF3800 domain-containing protein n=1 Tax=Hyphomicrobium sulfonivorans TaxID=121290 RepID=UPI001570D687|nr:DUF3800 domain-containing protein [Hyphomicrobium sulfonivorans]NSL70405.1 hypothetical protein [Hyphomicrobium sulfonivorans]
MTRFVYVDEAGISNPAHEPFIVVAGVIVHADKQLNELEQRLQRLVERHIPADLRDGFVFHATELFNGGGKVFCRADERWQLAKRLEIAHELASIPAKMKLPLAFGIVQRAHWPLTFDAAGMSGKERAVGQHVTAFMTCAMQVEMWMRVNTSNEVTMLIVEDNEQARKIIKDTQNQHRLTSAVDGFGPEERKYFPFKKIKSSPLFEQKRDSPALQIADFCAYVMKRRAMNDTRYGDLISLLRPLYAVHQLPEPDRPKT